MAGDPLVKIDNAHHDRRPHLHAGGWASVDRRDLPRGVTLEEALAKVREQLEEHGHLDADRLVEALS